MDSLELSAKTVEEAIELALKELDAERDEVEVSVISRGRAGILGIGAELARVRVVRLAAAQSPASTAMQVLGQLLSLMHVEAVPTIRSGGDGDNPPVIDVQGGDAGLLIGRRGETLRALQFLVNLLLSRQLSEGGRVIIDVEQYRERRDSAIQQLALRVAERVVATGRPATLEPMPAAERRMVHLALADHPHVLTQSVGEGEERKVSIRPKREP